MSTLGPDWWQSLSPYLDQALTMSEEERTAWLEDLRLENRDLAARIQDLLMERSLLAQEGFLEVSPVPLTACSAGQVFGSYRLLAEIGSGGMGTVWRAERSDGRFDRRVAVKFLRIAAIGGAQERFKREGKILGRLTHPHIAQLVDAGVSPAGQPFLVLEYVDGTNIDQYCDRRRLDVQARIRLFLDVLDAVAHAHANLIVHRDIKPSNVLVTLDGQVKLLDFGIAKLLQDDGHDGEPTLVTREGGGALTPEYAAPEQVTGGAVTTATDVYALGLLLYLLLTGHHPVGPGPHSAAELVKAIVDTEPIQPSEVVTVAETSPAAIAKAESRATSPERLRQSLRGDLDTIVGKTLKKNPEERYFSVSAMADDLRRYLLNKPIAARPDSFRYRATKFVSRNRKAVALSSLALLASIAGVVGTVLGARAARVQRDFAFRQLSRVEAVNDLNSFILSDAAPSGKPFTVNELLGRAEHIVERQRVNDASRVDLLISLGRQYDSQDEVAKARRLLEEAYRLSHALPDPSARAQASCALANAVAHGGDPVRSEALIQEGLRELPNGSQYLLDRVSCLLRGREVADENGAAQEALARVREAGRLLKQSPIQSEILELRVLMDEAESLRVASRLREACADFEQAAARLNSLGRDDTETAGTLFNNWAMALDDLGRPLEAEKIFRRAIDISRVNRSDEGVSPMLLLNYSRPLNSLGRLDEAADYAERAYAMAQKAGQQVVVNQSLLQRARIYRARYEFTRSSAMLDEVEPRLRQALPAGHHAFAVLFFERSLIAQGQGDLGTAVRLADQALTLTQEAVDAGQQGKQSLMLIFVRRSGLELQLGRPENAAAYATRCLSILNERSQPGTYSSFMGRAYLALARALAARGKREEARAAAHSAVEHLQNAIGADHPDTLSAQQIAKLDSTHP